MGLVMGERIHDRSIGLVNANMEIIAEFMLFHDTESDYGWVKCVPYYGLMKQWEKNVADPVSAPIQAGMMLPVSSFLGYIATVARVGEIYPSGLEYGMQNIDGGEYIRVRLLPGIRASDIAKLTGWPIEMIRDFYKDFFVVNTEEK